MKWLAGQQLFDVIVLVVGLVVSFALMSIHHPYTSTILSMAAAVVVGAHIVLNARRAPSS